ncbi:cytidine deaminase [Coprobacter sp.]
MKKLNLDTKITVCSYDELSPEEKILIDRAKEASNDSYAPYSHFQVGAAALLNNGEIIQGNNQENAAYPSGLCAERVTLFFANANFPDVPIKMLALAAQTEGHYTDGQIAPCGACRQVILETENRYDQPIRILMYGKDDIYIVNSIKTLLPLHFDKSSMEG